MYGINTKPAIIDPVPNIIDKYERGLVCTLKEKVAASPPKIRVIGVTIPCIGLESSGKKPSPMVASPAMSKNEKNNLDGLNRWMRKDAVTTHTPSMNVEELYIQAV